MVVENECCEGWNCSACKVSGKDLCSRETPYGVDLDGPLF